MPGRKIKRRKGHYLKWPAKPWSGAHKVSRTEANRRERHAEVPDE